MKQLQVIQQGLKAPKNQKNNFGNYKYRKAEDILAAVKPLLGGCTITLSDEIVLIPCEEERVVKLKTDKGRNVPPVIEYRTIHVAGRYFLKATATISDGVESTKSAGWAELDSHEGMSREQCLGAASSYARKYALCGLFGIDDSSDDPDAIDHRSISQQPQLPPQQQHNISGPLTMVQACNTIPALTGLWNDHPQWQQNRQIAAAFTARKNQLKQNI